MSWTPFPPTGYWATFLLADDFHARLVEGCKKDGTPRPPSVEHLAVVTWTPDGEAAVFNWHGRLTPVSAVYGPDCATFFVDMTAPPASPGGRR